MTSPQIRAMRSTGNKKHLNFLLEDFCQEAGRIRKEERERKSGTFKSVPEGEDVDVQDLQSLNTNNLFTPPYLEGGAGAKEVAKMVNTKRTPSGNFFQLSNPSLFVARAPGTRPVNEFETDKKRQERLQEQANIIRTKSKEASLAKEKLVSEKTWLTPQQKGDRAGGARLAKLVNSHRTPTGGFFNPHLG